MKKINGTTVEVIIINKNNNNNNTNEVSNFCR